MKRTVWTWGLPTVVIIVLLIISAFARHGSAGSEGKPAAEEAPPDKQPELVKAPEAAKPAAPPAAAAQPAAGKGAEDHRVLLETVGTLTAVNAFQTYLNIGFIADGKAKGTYTDRDARKVLDSVVRFLDAVDQKLAAVSKTELDKQDRASLEDMQTLSKLLRKQGKELEAYWDSGKEEDEARYENVRKDSWAALSRLMGAR